jgi:hypothetical protein
MVGEAVAMFRVLECMLQNLKAIAADLIQSSNSPVTVGDVLKLVKHSLWWLK